MPIRFRCPQCDRMLGIARRKAGTQTACPQCGKMLTVPVQDDQTELADLDMLLNPAANGGSAHQPKVAPQVAVAPPPQRSAPAPRPPQPAPPRKPMSLEERPLFEKGDVDAVLGIVKIGGDKLDLDDPEPRVKPVSGMDAMSLASDATKLVLSPGRATLLAVAVVVLLAVAFAAGYLIAAK